MTALLAGMRRRAVLGTLTALTVGLAGCSGGGPGPGAGGGSADTDEPTDTATEEPTDTPDERTPQAPESRFDGDPCPSFDGAADGTVCFHELGNGSAPVSLEPSAELFEPSPGDGSVETVTFTLHNRSGEAVGLNPYDWSVHRRTDGGWERVAPDAIPEPWLRLQDGQNFEWRLAVEQHPTTDGERTQFPVVDLADGVYAFAVTVAGESGPNSGHRTECVALFEVRRA